MKKEPYLYKTSGFPSTRYQGSKSKIVKWIAGLLKPYSFHTCLDAFGGTGVVSYQLKQMGKRVTYNDALRFNWLIGKALIENKDSRLCAERIQWLLQHHHEIDYPRVVQRNFKDVYYTNEENNWIDQTITNMQSLDDFYGFALAFYALAQACIIKRPYNLFHRKNLYLRLADVKRSFGNKTTWDKPFIDFFQQFVSEANAAVFDNGQDNRALNQDVFTLTGQYDLVYIDPPYISEKGIATDYREFYHFLEGLTMYETWEAQIDYQSKHLRLKRQPNVWANKHEIYQAFDRLFRKFESSILVVSYRSDGIPGIDELVKLMCCYKQKVHVHLYGQYQYALSKNTKSREVLLIGS